MFPTYKIKTRHTDKRISFLAYSYSFLLLQVKLLELSSSNYPVAQLEVFTTSNIVKNSFHYTSSKISVQVYIVHLFHVKEESLALHLFTFLVTILEFVKCSITVILG